MIDLSKLKECQFTTEVKPSKNIFAELGKNTYNYLDVISELIDNSIAARRENGCLEVTIKLYFEKNNRKNCPVRLTIADNANGISQEKLGQAITPAGLQSTNSLNEHGLGMKQAISALGKLEYLATKTDKEEKARVVTKFDFGKITTYYSDFKHKCGTEISIIELKPIVISDASQISRILIRELGARYRRFPRSG